MKLFSIIDILIDNPDSWIWAYEKIILKTLYQYAEQVRIFQDHKKVEKGDILFLLSCDKIAKQDVLALHKNNIVVHASDIPKGKGWSPVSWQVEMGLNKIPITLFEADQSLDSGDYYLKDAIKLTGRELIDEIREKQTYKTISMLKEFLEKYPMVAIKPQGTETFFEKRIEKNQELDINNSIAAQFNKLRVCDNERYPAHFFINGTKYILKIYNG